MLLLNLRQQIDTLGSSCLLDFVFMNFSELCINFIGTDIVKPDAYHLPFVIGFFLPFETSTRKCEYSYCKYAYVGYTL